MKDADRYAKVVQRSEEDGCFVGSIPDICGTCCHGPDPKAVFDELCQIAEEWIEIIKADGTALPVPTNFVTSEEEGRTDSRSQIGRKSTGKLGSRQ